MNKLEKVFTDFINEGGAAAKRITDADKKAMAYAELAKAIALSGLMTAAETVQTTTESVEEAPAKKEATGKDSLKESAGKGKAKKTSKKKEETVEVEVVKATPEVTEEAPEVVEAEAVPVEEGISEEWTEEMQTLKAEALETLNAYIDAWTEDFVCRECLGNFFEDTSITAEQLFDYIRPTNIDGFIAYLESLSE